jgi:hypothetical protein
LKCFASGRTIFVRDCNDVTRIREVPGKRAANPLTAAGDRNDTHETLLVNNYDLLRLRKNLDVNYLIAILTLY